MDALIESRPCLIKSLLVSPALWRCVAESAAAVYAPNAKEGDHGTAAAERLHLDEVLLLRLKCNINHTGQAQDEHEKAMRDLSEQDILHVLKFMTRARGFELTSDADVVLSAQLVLTKSAKVSSDATLQKILNHAAERGMDLHAQLGTHWDLVLDCSDLRAGTRRDDSYSSSLTDLQIPALAVLRPKTLQKQGNKDSKVRISHGIHRALLDLPEMSFEAFEHSERNGLQDNYDVTLAGACRMAKSSFIRTIAEGIPVISEHNAHDQAHNVFAGADEMVKPAPEPTSSQSHPSARPEYPAKRPRSAALHASREAPESWSKRGKETRASSFAKSPEDQDMTLLSSPVDKDHEVQSVMDEFLETFPAHDGPLLPFQVAAAVRSKLSGDDLAQSGEIQNTRSPLESDLRAIAEIVAMAPSKAFGAGIAGTELRDVEKWRQKAKTDGLLRLSSLSPDTRGPKSASECILLSSANANVEHYRALELVPDVHYLSEPVSRLHTCAASPCDLNTLYAGDLDVLRLKAGASAGLGKHLARSSTARTDNNGDRGTSGPHVRSGAVAGSARAVTVTRVVGSQKHRTLYQVLSSELERVVQFVNPSGTDTEKKKDMKNLYKVVEIVSGWQYGSRKLTEHEEAKVLDYVLNQYVAMKHFPW
ncbi:hypothetical protein FVE85_8967 [Porphyridium purpureum]|uniref:Uncharacterized protein n=1 Tax=Porphyridium purpureum TaxID=35688 RepID=A0A5J4YG89_PORPP|nr:hypothetical protein FVE85_8967 [Porphyridium purpureum]|eukprot:POR9353..scf226_27